MNREPFSAVERSILDLETGVTLWVEHGCFFAVLDLEGCWPFLRYAAWFGWMDGRIASNRVMPESVLPKAVVLQLTH